MDSGKSGNGVGFFTLLFLLFLGLKLCGVIDWSWWWIFAPLWGPAVVAMLLIMLLIIFYITSHKG